MDFKQFRYFVTVAEDLHVGRSAQRLGITQSALSQQIANFEVELGMSLFTRNRRRFDLTPAGKLFLEEARLALQQVDRAIEMLERSACGEIGRINLGYVDSAMLGRSIPTILRDFQSTHSGVKLALRGCNVIEQIPLLLGGDLDVGIVRGPLSRVPAGLVIEVLEEDELVVCLPAGHPLAARGSISIAELRHEMFVLACDPPGAGLAGQIRALAESKGFAPRVAQYATGLMTISCLVAAEIGVSILPASLKGINAQTVAYRPLDHVEPSKLFLLRHRDERRPAVVSFLSTCQRVITERNPRSRTGRRGHTAVVS